MSPVIAADHISQLIPYSPGKPIEEVQRELGLTHIVKLASNENNLGPSPLAVQAATHAAANSHRYPDAGSVKLREALAAHHKVEPNQIIIGNGSDEIIHLLGLVYLQPGNSLIQAEPSFVRYEASAILQHANCIKVPLVDDTHDLAEMLEAVDDSVTLIYLCNPNNPTGTIVKRQPVHAFVDSLPDNVLVVMDEAYREFVKDVDYPDSLAMVRAGLPVIMLGTFSKAYGLAGMRVGYGISSPEIIGDLNRVREPFNVNLIAQAAALVALGDVDHLERTINMVESGKAQLTEGLSSLGWTVRPTQANFLWVDTAQDTGPLFRALLNRGVIVRAGGHVGSKRHLRITIGTEAENQTLLNALKELL